MRRKFSLDGMRGDREATLEHFLVRMAGATPFMYDGVLVLVAPTGETHLYRDGGDVSFFEASRRFMSEVWDATGLHRIWSCIRQEKVKALARRIGWSEVGRFPHNYSIYEVTRWAV